VLFVNFSPSCIYTVAEDDNLERLLRAGVTKLLTQILKKFHKLFLFNRGCITNKENAVIVCGPL